MDMRRFGPEHFRRHGDGGRFPDFIDRPATRRAARARRAADESVAGRKVACVLAWAVVGAGLALSVFLLCGIVPRGQAAFGRDARPALAPARPVVSVAAARRAAPEELRLALPLGEVRVSFHRRQPAVRVPAAAVLYRLGAPYVAVVEGDETLRYRAVRLGRRDGQEVEVVSGLCGGEAVVVDMPGGLRDGVAVKKTAAPDAGPAGKEL